MWKYENKTVREALLQLKYRGKKALARDLADSLHDRLLEIIAEETQYNSPLYSRDVNKKYLLIPVPLHPKRQKMRGYNQSELIAKEIEAINPDIFLLEGRVLLKIKETPSQVSVQDRKKRLRNIRGSFGVIYPEKITGKNIVLIDDIITTGATITEAKKVLLKYGANKVLAVTIAS